MRGKTAIPQSLASLADYRLARRPISGHAFGRHRRARARGPDSDSVRKGAGLVSSLGDDPSQSALAQRAGSSATLAGQLDTIHRLIEAVLPLRIYYTSQSGFDTHASQRFLHQDLLRQVSQAVAGFFKNLRTSGLHERVVVLLFSEFGRRLKENATNGTDHGAAAPVFVAGRPVKGGLIGPPPNLSDLDDNGDPLHDRFPRRLRHAAWRWLAVDPEPILGRRDGSLAFLD